MINKEYLGSITDLVTEIAKTMTAEEQLKAATLIGLSQAIRDERRRLKMSQSEFAEHMNVKQSMVSKWESGNYNFTVGTLSHIATKLNLSFSANMFPKSKVLKFDQFVRYEQPNWISSKSEGFLDSLSISNSNAG